jgi:hypothetical protein
MPAPPPRPSPSIGGVSVRAFRPDRRTLADPDFFPPDHTSISVDAALL